MKNKRSLCLILIAAVALAIIAFGAGQYLGAGHLSHDSDKDNFTFPWTKAHQTTVRKKLDAFDRADIHLDNTDITLQDGDDFAMVYCGPKGTCPTLTVTDGKLTAKAAKTAVGAHQDAELTLTIPRGRAELKTLTLAADNGDITVEPSLIFVWLSNTGSSTLMAIAATIPVRMSPYSYLPKNSLMVRAICSLKAL